MSEDVGAEIDALTGSVNALITATNFKRSELDAKVSDAASEADRAQAAADQAAIFAGEAGPFSGFMHLAPGAANGPSLTFDEEDTTGLFMDEDGWIGFAISDVAAVYVARDGGNPFLGLKEGTGVRYTAGALALMIANASIVSLSPTTMTVNALIAGGAVISSPTDQTEGKLLTTAAVIPVAKGGTGATDAAGARAAIAAAPVASPTFTGAVTAPRVRLTDTGDVALGSTTHAFQIGADSGVNLAIDNNELQARSNGVASNLSLNAEGGSVSIGGVLGITSTSLSFSGAEVARFYDASVASNTDFPVGHILLVNSPSNINRNATTTIRLGTGNLREYTTDGSGDVVAGVWRSRGQITGGAYLFQRVS